MTTWPVNTTTSEAYVARLAAERRAVGIRPETPGPSHDCGRHFPHGDQLCRPVVLTTP